MDTPSRSGNKHVLLIAERASKFPFGFPLETNQALGVARGLPEVCLTVGVSRVNCCDGGKTFGMEVLTHLFRYLLAEIAFCPADHPRS